MIEVENLTRTYGTTKAISSLNFRIGKGEIVGFLGPNGAGKSTTMRILTGSLAATEGRALVGGIDVFEDPRSVKQMVGYLPETPPLYTEMTVREFLRFAARLKGAKDPNKSVEIQIERVGLSSVAHRLIAHLSKGFRQRVGIAQALVHDPAVLILDEPASGLDPAQRVEIRDLVRALSAGDTTVVLSTHVLPEVEAICDRAIIINQGRIVAEDTIENLSNAGNMVRFEVRRGADREEIRRVLTAIEGVSTATHVDAGEWRVEADRDVRALVARAMVDFDLLELTPERRLEDVFLQLTAAEEDEA